jgi:hypothetical protein
MKMLSEDDANLREMTADELARAWDLWFDLAQSTNAHDPAFTHGVFVGIDTHDHDGRKRSVDTSSASRITGRPSRSQSHE